jgi:hypothetical protein
MSNASVGRVRTRWLVLMAVFALMLVGVAPTALGDPPGNNGTVKIDGVEFDSHPNNEPHVGCVFEVDFYGFDEGDDLTAQVTFEAQPPTGNTVLLTDTVFIGEDAAGGGTDLDAEVEYDLNAALSAFEPHPQQGYHVKLTVNAEGSIGADTKHKVFWVTGCEPPKEDPGEIVVTKHAFVYTKIQFPFTGSFDFSLGGGESYYSGPIPAGSYTVTEGDTPGWMLDKVMCSSDDGSSWTISGSTVDIELAAGDTVSCHFYNAPDPKDPKKP